MEVHIRVDSLKVEGDVVDTAVVKEHPLEEDRRVRGLNRLPNSVRKIYHPDRG